VRINTHIQAFINGDESTLHYHIYQLGQGHRSFHFIRTFSFNPDSSMEYDKYFLFLNVLEMVMCLSFQTLPYSTIIKFLPFECVEEVKFHSIHLNIAPPLLQGQTVTAEMKKGLFLRPFSFR